jgi:hypothetical protein
MFSTLLKISNEIRHKIKIQHTVPLQKFAGIEVEKIYAFVAVHYKSGPKSQ